MNSDNNLRRGDTAVFEGMTSIRAVIMSKRRHIECLRYDRSRAEKRSKELSWLRHRAEEEGFPLEAADDGEISALASGGSHGGLIAVCGPRHIPELDADALAIPPRTGFFVMLEGVEDPYNYGYALRTVYASGADGVIQSRRSWTTADGVICRSSAGASEYLDIYSSPSPSEAALIFKKAGYRIICADGDPAISVTIGRADLSYPVFLIVGGEKRGLSRAVLDTADEVVRLGYGRATAAALSAASAASILAYQIFLYNGGSEGDI